LTFEHAFHEIAALLVIAAAAGALAMRLRQPLIVAFIAVGILAGPAALGLVTATEEIELLAELGIALLLFVVGLRLDVRLIRATGPVALAAGGGQIAFTAVVGLGLALALGLDTATALYVALALTFSSTIIVVKLLSDRREIDELHGRIAVGVLIVQDLVVVVALIALTAAGAGEGGSVLAEGLFVLLKGILLLAGLWLLTRHALTPALHRLAHTPELLVLSAIAWGVGLAAGGDALGFSQEVGAFLGGVTLASTPYRDAIAGRLVPLRDFLLLFFFLDLGMGLDLDGLDDHLAAAAVLSAFVLVGKPLIVMAIMGAMGYRRRVGFLTGVTLSQISEFSLILGALGVSLGHIGDDGLALITAVGLITISVSTYAIIWADRLFAWAGPALGVFERRREVFAGEDAQEHGDPVDVVVLGLGRYGARIAGTLARRGHRVLGVDFDPRAVQGWRALGHPAAYGDVEDPELPGSLPLADVRWVVSTVPRREAGLALLHALAHHGYQGRVAVTTHREADVAELRARGADAVLSPYADAVRDAVDLLEPARAEH
jgi:Kef-type K+ transport system membrane component KefB